MTIFLAAAIIQRRISGIINWFFGSLTMPFQLQKVHSVTENGELITNGEYEMLWKKIVVAYLK
jgi:hypothetical protein